MDAGKRFWDYLLIWVAITLECALHVKGAPGPSPSFAAPPVFSVAGGEVGTTGVYSMAKGDFNGDGKIDIAVVGFACANGTGFPQDSVAVYLGNGDGTFAPPVYYPAGRCPYEVIVGRLRGGNAPDDLIIVDGGVGNNVTVLSGNGDGTFQTPVVAAAFPTAITAAAVGDFNGDGRADLAVSVFGGSGETAGNLNTLGIVLANRDGTFQPPAFYQSINNPYGVAVFDFNKDGKLDAVIQNPEGLYLSLGNGDGTFLPGYVILEEPTTLISVNPPGPILNGPVSFTVADFNKDGNLDIALDVDGARIDVILGTGTGTFGPVATYLVTDRHSGSGGGQIAAASLTNSGNIDLVVATGYGATLAILYGNGDGMFQSPVTYPCAQANDASVVVADFNGDGHPDVLAGTSGGSSGSVKYFTELLNQGDGTLGVPEPQFAVVAPTNNQNVNPTNPVGVELADLTGNGKLDIIVTDYDLPIEPLTNGRIDSPPTIDPTTQQIDTHGTISVLGGNGDGTFQTEQQYYVGGRPIAVKAGDLTRDGKKDVVVVNAFSNTVSILKGNGDRTFQTAITIPVGQNPNALVLGDFDGDGKIDIALTNLVDNNVSLLINQSTPGTLSFKTPVTYSVGTYPAGIVSGDFNHDGKLDLAVVNSGDFFSPDPHTSLSILLGNGDGTFAAAATQQLWNPSGGDAIAAADFGRGEIDLAVANFATGEIMILRGNGDGTFVKSNVYLVGAGPEGIVSADFNRDGKIDIAVNNLNDNTVGMLLGNGDSTFAKAASRSDDTARPFGWATWGYPAFMAAGDLTGDGKPDIVVTNLFNAAVGVLRNTTVTPVQLTSVVSRKTHGDAGTFDLDLGLDGSGIECRSGGASGNYTLIFTFANALTRVSGASISSGTGAVTSSIIGNDPHQYIVELTGVTNAQRLGVTLDNVYDVDGNISRSLAAAMNVLIGDTTADRSVNSADISQTKSQSGTAVTSLNFREDLNADGSINSGDIGLVKSKSGTALP